MSWANHLIAILGLALLCGAWMVFQLWLKKKDPDASLTKGACSSAEKDSVRSGGEGSKH